MYITKLSQIAEKLNFLAQGLEDESQAETIRVHIKCDKAVKNLEIPNKIWLYTNLGILTSISTLDMYNGEVLDKEISVNLYDLYNIINNCDEVMTLELDSETKELVIGSYFNDTTDYEELQVRIPYLEESFPETTISEPKVGEFTLNATQLYSIIKELSIGDKMKEIDVVMENKKMFFTSHCHGLSLKLSFKSQDSEEYNYTFKRSIPLSLLKLIAGSGHYSDTVFEVYENFIYVSTKDYKFLYKCQNKKSPFLLNPPFMNSIYEDGFVVDTDAFFHNLRILNIINIPQQDDSVLLEKVDKETADLTVTNNGRYVASTRIQLAMLTDKKIVFSGKLFHDLFDRCGVDAVSVKISEHYMEHNLIYKLYNRLENMLIVREFEYNHIFWSRNNE